MTQPSPILSSRILALLRAVAVLAVALLVGCQSSIASGGGPPDDGLNGEIASNDGPPDDGLNGEIASNDGPPDDGLNGEVAYDSAQPVWELLA